MAGTELRLGRVLVGALFSEAMLAETATTIVVAFSRLAW
jgi:hypothetical protein